MDPVTREYIHILVAISDEDMRAGLVRILNHSSWMLRTAESREQALEALRSCAVPVLVCQRRDASGAIWESLLRMANQQVPATRVIVTDRIVDDALWAEVLNLGGFDVLPQPFDRREVFRTLTSAWRSWYEATLRAPAAA